MSGVMGRYDEYRHSGLTWLGAIPSHWEINRAKVYLREVDERSMDGSEERLSVSHLTGVTPRREKNITMFEAESYVGHKLCRPGDVVVNTMWAWMGALGVARHHGIVSPSYAVYRLRDPEAFDARYLDSLLRTPSLVAEFRRRSTGIRESRLRLYPERLLSIGLPRPPKDEQRKIAEYLDARSHALRRFETAKQRVRATLHQYLLRSVMRQLISCDSGQALRPGLEWTGDTPADWQVVALRHRYDVQLGKMLDAKQIKGHALVPYLRNVDVQWDRISIDDLPHMDIVPAEYERYTLKQGDLLVCEGGEVGRAAFWDGALELCGFQKALHRVRVLNPERDNPRFLFYLLFAAAKLGVFLAGGKENTIAHLTRDALRATRFPFPPKARQDAVVAALDAERRDLKRVETKIDDEMRLTREYSQRVLALSVTGGIDVRASVELPGAEMASTPEEDARDDALEEEPELAMVIDDAD